MNLQHQITVFCGAACLVAAAHAQTDAADNAGLPQAITQNGVSFICGGVGSDEADRMKSAAPQHNLMLTFADKGGEYLSDVHVDIADARGRSLLTTQCSGPIMLVDLPKGGRYRIRGEVDGRSVSGMATVGPKAKGTALHLVVPQAPATQG